MIAASRKTLTNLILVFEHPVWSALIAFVVYSLITLLHSQIDEPSKIAYYNYLADAFLHGQLHLRLIPPITNDLVHFNNQYYLYWPPLPAVLLMPFVALFGVGISDVFYNLLIASINVGLVAYLLRQSALRGIINIHKFQRAILVLFFAFGTVHITITHHGKVWFTAQLLGFLFTVLAFLFAITRKGWNAFFLAGLSVICAALTRNHLLFIGIWPAFYLLYSHREQKPSRLFGYSLVGLTPVLLMGSAYLIYNNARFGSPFDVGLDYHKMDVFFKKEYQMYGPFNLYYVPKNIYYQFIYYPFPPRWDFFLGGSLFLLSPVFFGAFWGMVKGRPIISTVFLLITILVVYIPISLLMGTGWVQFGPRYTLDFTTPLLLLTAVGIRDWSNTVLILLTAISVVHYVSGTLLWIGV